MLVASVLKEGRYSLMRIAGIQHSCTESKEKNIQKAEELISAAVKTCKPQLICLQELFTTTYFPSQFDYDFFGLSESIPGPTTDRMATLAKKYGIYIIAPIYEEAEPNLYFNSAPLISPDGQILGIYRKIHIPLFDYTLEDESDGKKKHISSYEKFYYTGGDEVPIFDTELGKIGILICWDNEFPELWRLMEMKGVELIFSPYAMSRPTGDLYMEQWLFEARCCAYYSSAYVMKVNRIGTEGDMVYRGRSLVIDPIGQLIAGPADEAKEDIIWADVDLKQVRELRSRRPRLMNRRPEVYKELSEPLAEKSTIFRGQPTSHGKTL